MEMNNFSAPEHGGTHFDAPAHFGKGKWHVDDIPVQRLVGPAVVIDIAWRARNDFDTQVRPQDLLDWEATHGRIPAGAIILMRSGWGANWPNKEQYFGSRTWNDTKTFHFPGIHVDAAKWLLANRAFVGVSVDTPSIDYGQSSHFLTHQTLLNENIYAMENVANMEKLPASGATVFVMPMLIQSGSGAPCRIVGILPDSPVGNTAAAAGFNNHTSTRMVVIVTLLFLALARKYS